jgi:hypothetical protein
MPVSQTMGHGSPSQNKETRARHEAISCRTRRQDADGARLDRGYDSYDQLTSANRTNGPNAALDAAFAYGYAYDEVGNRLHEDRGQMDLDGTYNPLNQLTGLKWSGKLDVAGNVASAGPFTALDLRKQFPILN